MDDTTPVAPPSTSRRTVLGGAAVLGAGAVLAACGGETNASGTGAAMSGAGSTTSGSDDSGSGTSVGKASEIPVGGGIYSADAKAFIGQPAPGTFKGFDAICTHKQCAMSHIEGDTITCQCHGSQFSVLDGSVKHGPATSPLTAVKVVDKNGSLFVQG